VFILLFWTLPHESSPQNAQSISGTLVNFLTALSLINNGVREILPFVRYISQFIDFEFKTIKSQDRGKGVVCAATWCVHRPLFYTISRVNRIMPAALVTKKFSVDFKILNSSPGSASLGFSSA
jgi:hypothetical protein